VTSFFVVGQQSCSRFRRRGDCDLQASVVLSRWLLPSSDRDKRKFDRCMARFRADSFVMRNDILPPLMKESEGAEFSYFIFTYYFSRYLYYNRVLCESRCRPVIASPFFDDAYY